MLAGGLDQVKANKIINKTGTSQVGAKLKVQKILMLRSFSIKNSQESLETPKGCLFSNKVA